MGRIPIHYDRRPPSGAPSLDNYKGAIVSMGGVQLQVMDSRETSTSGPWSDSVPEIASYDFQFKGELSMTLCNIGPAVTDTKTIRVNALKCLPDFNEDPHLPTGDITIVASSGLVSAVTDAIKYWNDILPDDVVNFPPVAPICPQNNNRCVEVLSEYPDDFPTACGAIKQYGGPTWTNRIQIPPNSWPPAARAAAVAHELGHLLGLDNRLNCLPQDTIMGGEWVCSQANYSPQPSDLLAIVQSVYGTAPKTLCQ